MRRSIWFAIALILSSTSTLPLAADTYPRQAGVDALHYVFNLTFSDSSNEIAGESTATVKLAAGVKEIALDLTTKSAH